MNWKKFMKIYESRCFPKILWHKVADSNCEFKDCIEGFENNDLLLFCYNGVVNDDMVKKFVIKKNKSHFTKKIIVFCTVENYSEVFKNNGINSYFIHKSLIELPTQNFKICNDIKTYDILSISRESKRKNIYNFLKYKFASITWDCTHFPSPEVFSFSNNKPFTPIQVSTFINSSRCGYFVCEYPGELLPLFEFWLCGVPVITNNYFIGGRSIFCNESNSIHYSNFKEEFLFTQHDREKIRDFAINAIMNERNKLNKIIIQNDFDEYQLLKLKEENEFSRW